MTAKHGSSAASVFPEIVSAGPRECKNFTTGVIYSGGLFRWNLHSYINKSKEEKKKTGCPLNCLLHF
jgi:hypothetical protein